MSSGVKPPFAKTSTLPAVVPTSSVPSFASARREAPPSPKLGVLAELKTTNSEPSKRTSPAAVPSQRWRSRVCTNAEMLLLGSVPDPQRVMTYCEFARWGSRAWADTAPPRTNTAASARRFFAIRALAL